MFWAHAATLGEVLQRRRLEWRWPPGTPDVGAQDAPQRRLRALFEEDTVPIEASLNFRRIDDTVTSSGSVVAEDLATLAANGYEVVINLLPDSSEYAVAGEADIVAGQGIDYISIPVDFAAPGEADLEAFGAAMDANAGRTIHVHCAANYRVSAFYGLYALRRGRLSVEQADEHLRSVWDPAEHPVWQEFIAAARDRTGT